MRGRIAIVVAALIFLFLAGAFYVLAYTQTGIQLAAAQLSRLDRLGIHVEGVSGRLSGPLRIARFELDNARAHVVVEDIVVDLHLRWLALQNINITKASAGRALLELKTAPDEPPPLTPPRFLPGFLSILIDRADLAAITLQLASGQTIAIDHVSTRARIRASRLALDDFVVDAPQFNAQGNVALTASRPLSIDVNASSKVHEGARPDLDLVAVVKGTADALQIEADLRAPAVAHVKARFTRLKDSWLFSGNIAAAEFALAPWLPENRTVLNDVALDFSLRPEVMQLAGKLTVPEVDPAPLTLDVTGRYADRTFIIAAANLAHSGSRARVRLEGRAAFGDGAPALNIAANWESLQWPLSASRPAFTSSSGNFSLSGPLPYRFTASANVAGQRLPALRGQLNGLVSTEALQIDRYDVALLDGNLSGTGSLEFAAPKRWTISATGKGINPVSLREDFPGSIDFAASAAGTGTTAQADFSLAVTQIGGMLRGQSLGGGGKAQRDKSGWRVQDTALTFGNAKLTLAGAIGDTLDLHWTFNATSLAALWPDAGGSLRFNGSAAGPLRLPHVVANIAAAGLKYGEWSVEALDSAIDVDPSGKAESGLNVAIRNLERGALQAETIHVSGSGNPDAHSLHAQVASRANRGTLTTAELGVSGHYANETWVGQIASGRLLDTEGKQPLRLAKPAQVVISRTHVDVEQLCLFLLESSLCGTGQWQRSGPWHVDAAGEDVPLDVLRELFPEQPQYLGKMDLQLVAQGSPSVPWRGDASIVLTDGAIIYRLASDDAKATETVQLGSGRVDLTATADSLSAVAGLSGTADSFIAANATLTRVPDVDFGHSPLSGRIRARMGDANLVPVLVAEIDHAGGVLTADVALSGQLDAPQIDGRIDLDRGELDLYRLNLALRQIELGFTFTANRLQFAGGGRAGDGSWNLGGTLSWRDGLPAGILQLKGQDLLVADLPEYRVVASPDLAFNIDGRSIKAAGEVYIPGARIQPRDLSGAVQTSPDSHLVHEEPVAGAGKFTVSSEIRIRLGEDVQLDTFGLQGKLGGDVSTTTQTGEIAVGRGELSVANGKYEAYGQKLDISRGRLLFDASPLDDPGLDIQAERTIETTKVGLNVRGTLREPRFGFYSEPSMSQSQILSYLLVGKPIDDLQNRDAAAVGSARDTLALQGGGIIAAQLGRRLGLEEVGVESQGANQTALVLGKFLSPRLFISYGISLTESINTLKLRYTISDRWILKTEAGEDQSADVEFTIERP